MKIAVIGTYGLSLPFEDFKRILPKDKKNTSLIVGTEYMVDFPICDYAYKHKINFLMNVLRFTPLGNIRNIIKDADKVLIFWDGESEKTALAIQECIRTRKDFTLYTTYPKS